MNIGNEIIDFCHKQGVKFSFDSDCEVLKCKNASEWIQEITHPQEGKMNISLCQKHMDDFDKDIPFKVVKNVHKSREVVQD